MGLTFGEYLTYAVKTIGMDNYQKDEISEGLKEGLDVSVYASPKYNEFQMKQIRLGLKHKVDVSVFADPKYDSHQMEVIRLGLESGVDVSIYADAKYYWNEMNDIRICLEKGINIEPYMAKGYNAKQSIQFIEFSKRHPEQKDLSLKRSDGDIIICNDAEPIAVLIPERGFLTTEELESKIDVLKKELDQEEDIDEPNTDEQDIGD